MRNAKTCENQCICLSHNKANRQLKTKASKLLQNGVKLNQKKNEKEREETRKEKGAAKIV